MPHPVVATGCDGSSGAGRGASLTLSSPTAASIAVGCTVARRGSGATVSTGRLQLITMNGAANTNLRLTLPHYQPPSCALHYDRAMRLAFAIAVAGCGRVGFDPLAAPQPIDAAAMADSPFAPTTDAPAMAVTDIFGDCPSATRPGTAVDTSLDSTRPTENYGGRDQMRVGNGRVSLLRFDLRAIAVDATVFSATLHITVSPSDALEQGYVAIAPLHESWTRAGGTRRAPSQEPSPGQRKSAQQASPVADWILRAPEAARAPREGDHADADLRDVGRVHDEARLRSPEVHRLPVLVRGHAAEAAAIRIGIERVAVSGPLTWWANRKSQMGLKPSARCPPHHPGKPWWTTPPITVPQPEHIEYVAQFQLDVLRRPPSDARNAMLAHVAAWMRAARRLLHEHSYAPDRADLHTTDGLLIAADDAIKSVILTRHKHGVRLDDSIIEVHRAIQRRCTALRRQRAVESANARTHAKQRAASHSPAQTR